MLGLPVLLAAGEIAAVSTVGPMLLGAVVPYAGHGPEPGPGLELEPGSGLELEPGSGPDLESALGSGPDLECGLGPDLESGPVLVADGSQQAGLLVVQLGH